MIKYIFEGKRWFDKANGNTYHSVSIIDADRNELIYCSGFTYGYGDQWKHTGYDYMLKKGLMKDRFDYEWIHENVYFNCVDVSRRKELDLW